MSPDTVIYLDYAATSPLTPQVVDAMRACLTQEGPFANPSSHHLSGLAAKKTVEMARAEIANILNAASNEIIFTSGATESCNLALKGAAQLYTSRGRHIITVQTEHSAVLDSCAALEKMGWMVTYLTPESNGLLNIETLRQALRPNTVLVSIMQVNNETGVIQDISGIAGLTAANGILLHVDAAQAIGKVSLDVQTTPVDLVSFCAHKCGGPKGIGALYIRRKPRIRVAAQNHGGGQEEGQRAGTLPTHQITGMASALSLATVSMADEYRRITGLRQQLLDHLRPAGWLLQGDLEQTVPHIVNLRFPGIPAKKLLEKCPTLALSTGSACHGKSQEPSHVLRAMGLSREEALSAVRFSFGRFTTPAEITEASKRLLSAVQTFW